MPDATTSERGAAVRVPPPLVFAAFALLGVLMHYTVGTIPLATTLWTRAIGVVVMLAGIGIIASALAWFTRTGQDPKPWKPTPELIFRGPYRFTRNPIYVGMTCI